MHETVRFSCRRAWTLNLFQRFASKNNFSFRFELEKKKLNGFLSQNLSPLAESRQMSIRSFTNIANQYPIVPENEVIEPLVQCGVLYLGTVPISSGLRALESIQEPFSHRYPVDGTNTVRGENWIEILKHWMLMCFFLSSKESIQLFRFMRTAFN